MEEHQTNSKGHHIFAVVHGVDPEKIGDRNLLERVLDEAILQEGFTSRGKLCYEFKKPRAYTIVIILGESHLSLSTYPDDDPNKRHVEIDITTCRPNPSGMAAFRYIASNLAINHLGLEVNISSFDIIRDINGGENYARTNQARNGTTYCAGQ